MYSLTLDVRIMLP